MIIQSPLVIVDPVIVEFLVIVDRFCRPIVYFSMYFSRNSGITRYSGHFAANGRIHYYERRLYISSSSLFAGKLEILASCTKDSTGNFYLYTLPDNWRSPENWERRILAGNFQPVQSTFNPNTMAPGKFRIFYPSS